MAQRPKTEVREAILAAAAQAFAEVGFERATLGDIVARAGTSIGNLYKYFANKDELFAAFLPDDFSAALSQRIRAQVEALGTEPDVFALDDTHPYRRASEALLRFTIEHRERIVFLLSRAAGTKHEAFIDGLVRLLVDLALQHAKHSFPDFTVTAAKRRALARIYSAFVSTLASIFEHERSERALRESLALHSTYHFPGLKAFFSGTRHVAPEGTSSR